MNAPLVFMDTETTGLSLDDDIWEFAAVRRDPDGTETELHMFIEHDRAKCRQLPIEFRTDHYNRYLDHRAVSKIQAASDMYHFLRERGEGGRPHIVGAVPNFDTERIARTLAKSDLRAPWHYHLIDVENLAVGYLFGQYRADQMRGAHRGLLPKGPASLALPWDSNELSKQVGIDPEQFERHTAMGDVRWAMAIYDAVMAVGRSS